MKEHISDDCDGPNINGFGVGGLVEYFRGHVEERSALGLEVEVVDFEFS